MKITNLAIIALVLATGCQHLRAFRECSDCPEMLLVPSGTFVTFSPRHNTSRASTR